MYYGSLNIGLRIPLLVCKNLAILIIYYIFDSNVEGQLLYSLGILIPEETRDQGL
jgi:hypothetical protein